MKLPRLPYQAQRARREIVALGGVNYSDNYRDGDLAHSENLSTRRWPYFTVRRARGRQEGYTGVTALTAWDRLVAVQGTQLLYDGQEVGAVTAGEKQFAVVNTKLVIWPDKVYLDLDSRTVKPLAAKAEGTGGAFTASTLTVSGWPALTGLFKAGDCITISGCTAQAGNNKDVVIRSLTDTAITASADAFIAGAETGPLALERRVPDLDFICESENRLWGCSNRDRTIYSSALGDPTNFYVYDGLATDSYAVAVGSQGEFTGCRKLSSSVLFWKEGCLHKLLGSYPTEYTMYTYSLEGLKAGCHKSMQVINETLFYMGVHGIYAYSGGTPSLISQALGERSFSGGVAGNDGERYYLSVTEGEQRHLLVYDYLSGIWLREDDARAVDFARIGGALYFADGSGEVWLADSGAEDPELRWTAQFKPFYETIQGRKRHSRLLLRLELAAGAWLRAEIRCDGGPWREAGRAIGKGADVVPLVLAPSRCDRFEVRLTGKGPCALLSMMREFQLRSER